MCIILKKHKIHKFVQMTIEFLNSLQGLKVTLFHLSIDIKHFTCFLFYSGVQETGLAPFLIICNIADLRLSVGHVHTFISRQGKKTVSSGCFPHYVFQTSSHHPKMKISSQFSCPVANLIEISISSIGT